MLRTESGATASQGRELVGNDKVCKAGHAYQGLQVSSY